jgi:hypothetical protein
MLFCPALTWLCGSICPVLRFLRACYSAPHSRGCAVPSVQCCASCEHAILPRTHVAGESSVWLPVWDASLPIAQAWLSCRQHMAVTCHAICMHVLVTAHMHCMCAQLCIASMVAHASVV